MSPQVPSATSDIDVAIDGISISYGSTTPVRGLSLDVRKGEFLSLLGPSGCGKTTTLRAVAGFIDPHEGDIRIGGRSVLGLAPNQRNIGMVYQDYALFPHMSVRQNVAYGLRMRRTPAAEATRRANAMIDLLQLGGLADRAPAQLSGGQQQRVALARALVINPSVLLLDEPLGALDKQLRSDMQFELRRLQREVGTTAIFVTHDQEEALSLSDRIAVMKEGCILQVGTPQDVYSRPTHRVVAEFIGTANFLRGRVAEPGVVELRDLPGRHDVPGAAPGTEIELLLRPEQLRVVARGAPSAMQSNRLPARVGSHVFQGSVLKYQLHLSDDRFVRADVPVDAGANFEHGAEVDLLWRAGDARVYRNDVMEI